VTQEVLTIQTVDAVDVHLARAGIGSRGYAFIIDWHIRFIAAFVWFIGAIAVTGVDLKEGYKVLVVIVPAAALYFLYHPVLEILMQGQTPGKRWINLRIVTADGSTPGAGALLMRNVFRIVDSLPTCYGLGLLVMFCTRDQVRIGDMAAGTLVVYDLPAPKETLADAVVHDDRRARIVPLLEEWLERWVELDGSPERDRIALGLLAKAGDATPPAYDGHVLRLHVMRWLKENARAAS
jgi:uncharacterized RDD family membrane protein YckC